MNYNKILKFLENHGALDILDLMPKKWIEALIAIIESRCVYYLQHNGQTYTLIKIDKVHFNVSYVGASCVCFQYTEDERPCIKLFYADFQKTWFTDKPDYIKTLEKEENTMEKTNVEIEIEIKENKPEEREVEVKDISQFITKVIADPKKKITVVIFMDGKKEVVKCAQEDEYDVYVGVSLALSRRMFGTNGAFHKCVDGKLTIVEPKKKKLKVTKNLVKKVNKDLKEILQPAKKKKGSK